MVNNSIVINAKHCAMVSRPPCSINYCKNITKITLVMGIKLKAHYAKQQLIVALTYVHVQKQALSRSYTITTSALSTQAVCVCVTRIHCN